MNRRLSSASVFAFCFALALTGCQKSAEQATTSTPADSAAAPASGDSSAATPDASKTMMMKKEAPPPPKPIVVPEGTVITVVLDQAVGSKISTPGQAFSATVQAPIEVDGRLAIPKGARASGIVKDAKPAGRFKGAATLALTLTSVTIKNEDYNIQTSAPSQASTGKGKRTAALVGGGAGGGAAIGAIAGGGKGALIGGLIGAAAGTGGAGLTGNRDITLAAETALTFKLVDPLEIKPHR
jgi:hypothetical protein